MEDREIETLLKDIESDRVERTETAKKGDRFRRPFALSRTIFLGTLRMVCCSLERKTMAVAPARRSPMSCSAIWVGIAMTEIFSRFHP